MEGVSFRCTVHVRVMLDVLTLYLGRARECMVESNAYRTMDNNSLYKSITGTYLERRLKAEPPNYEPVHQDAECKHNVA